MRIVILLENEHSYDNLILDIIILLESVDTSE